MFPKTYIVRKLNAPDDINVGRICSCIESICDNPVKGSKSILISKEADIDNDTLIIAVGGDGTMLEAMRLAHKYQAVAAGVNLGRVGFLTDFVNTQSQLFNDLYDAIFESEGENHIEERIALNWTIVDKGEPSQTLTPDIAFNEFVLSNRLSDHLIKYTLFIGDRCAGVHRANALIISTPTGSTAYALSAGGGLLLPCMEAIQICPVAPVSMTSRPIIIPSSADVRVSIETEGEWVIKADGRTLQTFNYLNSIDTQLVIGQHVDKVHVLHTKDWSFFDMLTKKLNWNAKTIQ